MSNILWTFFLYWNKLLLLNYYYYIYTNLIQKKLLFYCAEFGWGSKKTRFFREGPSGDLVQSAACRLPLWGSGAIMEFRVLERVPGHGSNLFRHSLIPTWGLPWLFSRIRNRSPVAAIVVLMTFWRILRRLSKRRPAKSIAVITSVKFPTALII